MIRRIATTVLLALLLWPTGAHAQRVDLDVSLSEDFSTRDRVFPPGSTVHVRVRTNLDATTVVVADLTAVPTGSGDRVPGELTLRDEAYFGSFDVDTELADARAWTLYATLADASHRFRARVGIVIDRGDDPRTIVIRGVVGSAVTGMGGMTITVGTEPVLLTSETRLLGFDRMIDLVGQTVEVVARRTDRGLEALAIRLLDASADEITIVGPVTESTDAQIRVRNTVFRLTEQTRAETGDGQPVELARIKRGTHVRVQGTRDDPGWVAVHIVVLKKNGKGDFDEVRGHVEALTDASVTVAGLLFLVTPETAFDGFDLLSDLAIGDRVDVSFRDDSGTLVATRIERKQGDAGDGRYLEISGVITALEDAALAVDGVRIAVDNNTRVEAGGHLEVRFSDLATDMTVEVRAVAVEGGDPLAVRIRVESELTHTMDIEGSISGVDLDRGEVTVGETTFKVTDETRIQGERGARLTLDLLQIGDEIHGVVYVGLDGVWFARHLKVRKPHEEDDVEVGGVIEEIGTETIKVAGLEFVVTVDTEITDADGNVVALGDLVVGQVVKIEGYRSDAGILTADEIRVRGELQKEASFEGPYTGDSNTFSVAGVEFVRGDDTRVHGFSLDASALRVEVRYVVMADGSLLARRVRARKDRQSTDPVRGMGTIGAVTDDSVELSGITFFVTDQTEVVDAEDQPVDLSSIPVGSRARVWATFDGQSLTATRVAIRTTTMVGSTVSGRVSDTIEVAGRQVLLTSDTDFVDAEGNSTTADAVLPGLFVELIIIDSTNQGISAGKSASGEAVADQVIIRSESSATSVTPPGELPTTIVLLQNYPNPFNPETSITFTLDRQAPAVRLTVFNLLGQHVRSLYDGAGAAGTYSVRWDGTATDGTAVASGVYLYRLTVTGESTTRSMTLLR